MELQKAIEKINNLKEDYGQIDWGGHNEIPISETAVSKTSSILKFLSDKEQERDEPFKQPEIMPVPNGGLQLEWEDDDKYLEIEVKVEGTIELISDDKNLPLSSPEKFYDLKDQVSLKDILQLVEWCHN